MSAYLISADGYATFETIFRSEFNALDLERLFIKYQSKFAQSEPLDRNLYGVKSISNFLVAKMVNANSQNIHYLYDDRCNENEIIFNTEQAKRFVRSGSPNRAWLKAVEINKQLIVKAIDWWQYQTCDGEIESPIYQLLDEAIGQYAVSLVKEMPGNWYIPRLDEATSIV